VIRTRVLPVLVVVAASSLARADEPAPPSPAPEAPAAPVAPATPATPEAPAAPSLDFDLLAPAPPPPTAVDTDLLLRRRRLLTLHQGFGFALATLMAGSIVTGQLNYEDRFRGGSTGQYMTSHRLFVYSTALTFTATGLLAAFAPVPPDQPPRGLDRIRLHEIGMIGATVGMAAEVTLGILTRQAEGRVGQARLAQTHLVIGYTTLAFMLGALSAIVF
jgi:hypothetical protein